MIILSACNTDKPIFESAGAYSGLPRLFIESGAGSVLTTQWNIDSYSAKLFVSETLSLGAKNGLSLSEALKNTMSRFINGFYGETFKHPFYWAPYVLVGEN